MTDQNKWTTIKENFYTSDGKTTTDNLQNLHTYHYSWAIKETLSNLDVDSLKWIVEKIDLSRKILIYGIGSSKRACQELTANLIKLGYNVFFFEDIYLQLLNIPMLDEDDLVIIVSKSGQTKEIAFLVNACHSFRIPTVMLTSNTNYEYKEKVTKILSFTTYEQPIRITAISSKISQLVVVDLLYIEVFNRNYDKNIQLISAGTELINMWNRGTKKT